MEIISKTATRLSSADVNRIAILAGLGFGQLDTSALRQDTQNHIDASDKILLAYDGDGLVAFSMTRRALWR